MNATRTFLPDETREACEFLAAGKLLLLAVDGTPGAVAPIDGDAMRLRMGVGPLRLARIADAEVFPLLIVADGYLKFTAHVGKPVPREMIRDRHSHTAACAHVVREFEQVLQAHPTQCWSTLLEAIEAPRPVAEAAA